jgi:hypothetical protein
MFRANNAEAVKKLQIPGEKETKNKYTAAITYIII